MKTAVLCMTIFLSILLCMTCDSFAQERVVPVASGIGTLNAAIAADSNGRRTNPNTWYELARDGYYVLTAPIANNKFLLQIRAASGSGRKPIVRPGTGSGGTVISRCFEPYAEIKLRGLYVSAITGDRIIVQNNIRTRADSARLDFADCHFDRDLTAVLRFDTRWCDVTLRRNYFSNLGLAADENGRGFDDRGNPLDTVIIEDNVYYNLTGRLMRDGGGVINYLKFNHNTVVNVGDRMGIGEVLQGFVTNNLFWNHRFLGDDTLGQYFMETKPWLGAGTQVLDIHHNNLYLHSGMIAAYPTTSVGQVRPVPDFDSLAANFIDRNGYGQTNTTHAVAFTNGPRNEIQYMLDVWNTNLPPTSRREMYAGPDSGNGTWGVDQMPWDFRYPTSSLLYTMGTDGTPLGALFPFGLVLGVERDNAGGTPAEYSLQQNYPNPFNPATTIVFAIPQREFVTLTVNDLLGREVCTLVSEHLNAGTYKARFDGSRVASGVYFYHLQAGSATMTRKLSLIK